MSKKKGWYIQDSLSGPDQAARSRASQEARVKKIEARKEKKKVAKQKKETPRQRVVKKKQAKAASDKFLDSYEWRKLRYRAIIKHGRACMCCGRTPPAITINVDHVKPRKKFPELALDINNLQILCHECNHGKGNWDQTDWRPL